MKKRYIIKVCGDVQGVFFRQNTQRVAQSLNLTGWIKNEPNGSVLIVAEGNEEALDKFVGWCHHGPPSATVEEVEVTEEDYKDEFEDFRIRY